MEPAAHLAPMPAVRTGGGLPPRCRARGGRPGAGGPRRGPSRGIPPSRGSPHRLETARTVRRRAGGAVGKSGGGRHRGDGPHQHCLFRGLEGPCGSQQPCQAATNRLPTVGRARPQERVKVSPDAPSSSPGARGMESAVTEIPRFTGPEHQARSRGPPAPPQPARGGGQENRWSESGAQQAWCRKATSRSSSESSWPGSSSVRSAARSASGAGIRCWTASRCSPGS